MRSTIADHEPLVVVTRESRSATHVVRTIDVEGQSIYFEIGGEIHPPTDTEADFAAVAMVFAAMRARRPLHIQGSITEQLLRNLEEFQEAWAAWRPHQYTPVPITAARVSAGQPPTDGSRTTRRAGVFAFSGGVDATFALLRHHMRRASRRNVTPVAGILVHGFDIRLDQREGFDVAHSVAQSVMNELGVPLCVVRTNWRDVLCRDWEMEFGAGLAACLHLFSGLANIGVIGSDEDYAHVALPWGSNPVTNHYLSGGGFQLQTEGGGFSRTARVALICDTPSVAAKLRVCWEGPMTGRNCGQCEKCVRTKLNFMANRQPPFCFDRPPTLSEVLRLTARNAVQAGYLTDILWSARRNSITDPWVSALAWAVRWNLVTMPVRTLARRVRAQFRKRYAR